MNCQARLLVLWSLAALASLVLIMKGRGLSPTRVASPAFSHAGPDVIRVKITGVQNKAGVYYLPHGSVLGSVINMAPHGVNIESAKLADSTRQLKDGEWVIFNITGVEPTRISTKMMSAAEKMLLGVPLDPSSLTESDWERLPGIGPALARRIVLDRQCNGGFRSARDLERIPGIGRITVDKIEQYF